MSKMHVTTPSDHLYSPTLGTGLTVLISPPAKHTKQDSTNLPKPAPPTTTVPVQVRADSTSVRSRQDSTTAITKMSKPISADSEPDARNGSTDARSGSTVSSATSRRTVFTRHQLSELETRFREQTFLSKEERAQLADDLGLAERQIMIWFQNRRGRLKRRGPSDTAYSVEKTQGAQHPPSLSILVRPPVVHTIQVSAYLFIDGKQLPSSRSSRRKRKRKRRYPEAHQHPYQHLMAGSSPPDTTPTIARSDVTHNAHVTPVTTEGAPRYLNNVPLNHVPPCDVRLPTSNTTINAPSGDFPPNVTVMPPNVTVQQLSKSRQGTPHGRGNFLSVENGFRSTACDFRSTMGSAQHEYGWEASRAGPVRHARAHTTAYSLQTPTAHSYVHNHNFNYNWTTPQTSTGYSQNYPHGHQGAHFYNPGSNPNQNGTAATFTHQPPQGYLPQTPVSSPPQQYLSQNPTPYTAASPCSPYPQHSSPDAPTPPNQTLVATALTYHPAQGYTSQTPIAYSTHSPDALHPRQSSPDATPPPYQTTLSPTLPYPPSHSYLSRTTIAYATHSPDDGDVIHLGTCSPESFVSPDAPSPPHHPLLAPALTYQPTQQHMSHTATTAYVTGSSDAPHPPQSGTNATPLHDRAPPFNAMPTYVTPPGDSSSVGPGAPPGSPPSPSTRLPQTAPCTGDPDSTPMLARRCSTKELSSPAYTGVPVANVSPGPLGGPPCTTQTRAAVHIATRARDPDSTSMLSAGSSPPTSPPGYNFNPCLKEFNCVPDFPDICSSSMYRPQAC